MCNYNPKKAIKSLKSHGCTGGPSSPSKNNSKVWTCGGQKAELNLYTTTAPARELSVQVFQQQAMAIGIKLDIKYFTAQPDFFTNLLPTGTLRPGRVRLERRPGSVRIRRDLPVRQHHQEPGRPELQELLQPQG